MSDNVKGQTTVNSSGYLTEMNSINVNTANNINDFKKARLLLKSVINTNSKHIPGWIAAARLEELDGKIQQARNIIAQAAQNIFDSEDIWLEAARLHPPEQSKLILAKAISHITNSEKLWSAAAKREFEKEKKIKVLRKALEYIPNSESLWKQAIELENEDDAKILLERAVECVPNVVDFWLALAKLEDYENARGILNRARKAIPTDHTIWIHAAKLEEAQNNENHEKLIEELIDRCIRTLANNGINLSREQWIREAENCETSGSIKTCQAIIKVTMNLNVPESDREKVWLESAQESINRGMIECARQIYANALYLLPETDIWLSAIELEKTYGSQKSQEYIMSKAVKQEPEEPLFWLIYAKYLWDNVIYNKYNK